MTGFSLAHLSDLHLPLSERPPRWRDLMSKRLFSYLSWKKSRRRIHRPEVLERLMQDIRASATDHLVVTGDLVNLALPEEFEQARDWLTAQGGGDAATVTPGNHDALVPVPWSRGLGRWAEWMGDPQAPEDAFPFVKRMGDVALIGVSSAVPTAPFLATGRVGDIQLLRLARILALLAHEGAFRVVMIHHPITDGAVKTRKALEDRAGLRQVLMEYGAELVLHGHAHHATVEHVPGPQGDIPVIGAPSASSAPGEGDEPAGWRKIDLTAANDGWDLRVSTRSMTADGGFESGQARTFRIARPRMNAMAPGALPPG